MASTIETTIENGILTIRAAGKSIVVDPAKMPADIVAQAALHGFKQKLVDAAALSRDPDTGASATADQKFYAMNDVFNQIASGDWNRRAQGDGSAGAGLLVTALARVTGRSLEDCAATVKGWDKATQVAMMGDPQIAPVVIAIKAERAAKATKPGAAKVDTGALLAGFVGTKPAPVMAETHPTVADGLIAEIGDAGGKIAGNAKAPVSRETPKADAVPAAKKGKKAA